MNPHTKLSAKGQVVLPHAVRTSLGWSEGKGLEVIQHADAVTLRPVRTRPTRSASEVFAMLSRIGPKANGRLSDEDMDRLVAEQVLRRHPSQ